MAPETPRPALTPRQQKILDAIRTEIEQKGYPPSMRQIGDMVGLASLSSVTHQLGRLEKMGYIRRDPKLPRAIEVLDASGNSEQRANTQAPKIPELPTFEVSDEDMVPIPLVGRIAAGGQSNPLRMCFPSPNSWLAAASSLCCASKEIR